MHLFPKSWKKPSNNNPIMLNYLFEIPTWCLWNISTFSNTGSDFPCGNHEAQPVSHWHPRHRGVTLGSLSRGCSWMTGLIHPGVPSICCWHLLCGLKSLSDDVIPCLCPILPHEGNPAAMTSAVKVQGGWICWAGTETSGYVMLHKLPVTVTPHESPVKRYLTTIPCVLICSGGLFSFGSWLFFGKAMTGGTCRHFSSSSTTCILQVDYLGLSMCNISQCLHSCDQFSTNKQSTYYLYK